MINMVNISASAYSLTVSVILLLYYALLLVAFKLKDRLRLKTAAPAQELNQSFFIKESASEAETKPEDREDKSAYRNATLLTDELKAFFDEFSRDDLTKEETVFRLRKILQKYPSISDALRDTINHYIYSSVRESFQIEFSDEELSQLHTS
jgi:hypothetical protein